MGAWVQSRKLASRAVKLTGPNLGNQPTDCDAIEPISSSLEPNIQRMQPLIFGESHSRIQGSYIKCHWILNV